MKVRITLPSAEGVTVVYDDQKRPVGLEVVPQFLTEKGRAHFAQVVAVSDAGRQGPASLLTVAGGDGAITAQAKAARPAFDAEESK